MSSDHSVLVFVAGPQAGQRVTIRRGVAVLGRGGQADVPFSEVYVSRRQARYELLHAGPTLENLSEQGTWINGKKYGSGKKVLLETGDLIGLGRTTEILFVAAGDDPETALAAYRESLGSVKDAFGRWTEAVEPPDQADEQPEQEQGDEPGRQEASAQDQPETGRPSEMSAGQRMEAERKSRRRKIAIGLGAYFAVLPVFVIILVRWTGCNRTGGNTNDSDRMPVILTREQIGKALRSDLQRTPHTLRKTERLNHALGLYQQYGLNESYLYECAQAFKESLAYGGQRVFDNPEHYMIYRKVLAELIKVIQTRYRNACISERKQDWAQADRQFDRIRVILRQDEDNPVFRNVKQHARRVKRFLKKKKSSRRKPWT